MRKLLLLPLLVASIVLVATPFATPTVDALSGSEFQAGRIIDDNKFFDGSGMSLGTIQAFLNAKVPVCDTWGTQIYSGSQTRAQRAASQGVSTPFTCLKTARDTIPGKPTEAGLCTSIPPGSGTAAEIIYWVSLSCGVSPQVMLVLLQKEQSLITDDWPWPIQYRSATGYGCPDTAPCDSEYYGLFNQIYNAARQYKRYARDANLFSYRSGRNNYIQYNPNAACGGSNVYIQNQATAGLYNYTPYQPNASALNNLYGSGDGCGAYGNRNFWRLYNDWFGSTLGPPDYSCKNSTNAPGATGAGIINNRFTGAGGIDSLSLILPNNTGSACIEAHTWGQNQQNWISNVATNLPAITPTDDEVISGNFTGTLKSELAYIKYRNTGSGRIEFHVWDSTYQRWLSNTATNHPEVVPGESRVISLDTNGDGQDELALVKYQNTGSGKVEIHTWNPGQQSWASNIATNLPATSEGEIISGNLYGDLRSELIYVKYQNTGSGKVEIHTWNPGQQSWYNNIATNHPSVNPSDNRVMSTDTNGDGRDELVFVKLRNTGSGKVEVHTWLPGQQNWASNLATNYPSLP